MRLTSLLFSFFILPLLTGQSSLTEIKIEIDGEKLSLAAAMEATRAPGFSYYLDRGEKCEAYQLGFTTTERVNEVDEHTVFQVGSPANALLAFATLKLVEEGKIELDRPANEYLKRWQIPGRKPEQLTVRNLLYNRGRLGTTYKPAGYRAGETLPALVDILNGTGPAKNKRFHFRGLRKVDANFEYGSWLVLQLLLEDIHGKDFATLMQEEVLQPLGMSNSFYTAELSGDQQNKAAYGHWEDGKPVEGGYFRYPELANHGLWSSPADYAKFVRHLMEAAKGKDNSMLSQELAKQGLSAQFGSRSLIFHVNEYKNPFWGGATKGYYFYVQANLELDYVVVAANNRQLNWQLCNKACWAAYDYTKGLQKGKNRLGIFYQDEDLPQLEQILPELKKTAHELDTEIELISTEAGAPIEITATPAYVFQNKAGRSIHAGKHLDLAALEVFLKTNLVSPRASKVDTKENIITLEVGRQKVVIPVKLTETKGAQGLLPASTDFAALIEACYFEVSNKKIAGSTTEAPYQLKDEVDLYSTDRRFYLDVHPFVNEDGKLHLSYAIFSQFNCHDQLADNFGQPVTVEASEAKDGIRQLVSEAFNQMENFRRDVTANEVPRPISPSIPLTSWEDLGWAITAKNIVTNEEKLPVFFASQLNKLRPIQTGLPAVQFNFPAPLDRYAGVVERVSGQLAFTNEGAAISGTFTVDVASLTMGNGSLDNYVVNQALNVVKHPRATITFRDFQLNPNYYAGQKQQVKIPARFTLKGKVVNVVLIADLTPEFDVAGQPQLKVITEFDIDIKRMFGLKGPDGPAKVKNNVVVQGQFVLG